DVRAQLLRGKREPRKQKTARRRLCVATNNGAGLFQFDAVSSVVMRDVITPLGVATEDARNPLTARGLPRPMSSDQDIPCRNAVAPLGKLLGQVLHRSGLLGTADFPRLN